MFIRYSQGPLPDLRMHDAAFLRRPPLPVEFLGGFYVLVLIEHGSRRLVHCKITQRPSAGWTLQRLRKAIVCCDAYRYLLHDRDSIFARSLDESIRNPGLTVLKSPPHSPKANAIFERAIGTIRRECLDWLIPISELHLRSELEAWVTHYHSATAVTK